MDDIRLPYGVVVPAKELDLKAAKAGGPGGQSVNTTDSKVELRWDVRGSSALSSTQRDRLLERLGPRLTNDGVLLLSGSEHKSQQRNREAVLARFGAIVGDALAPPRQRRRTRPSRGAKQRRLDAKKRRAEVKKLRRPPET